MAATDVLPSSPMTPGHAAPWSSFEDYLDFPSPLPTPRLAPLHASSLAQPASNTSNALLNTPTYSLQTTTNAAAASTATPPPAPGSSPEVLFRYYLAAELRRIGSSADDSIIDKYVAQHYDSFTKALDRQQNQAANANSKILANETSNLTTMTDVQTNEKVSPFRSPPPMAPSSAPYLLNSTVSVEPSIDPHMMELSNVPQTFAASPVASFGSSSASRGKPSTSPKGKYRDTSAVDEDDEMSEGEEEDDKDILADLVENTKSDKSTATSKGTTAIEETPIAGSIMGPANELRPDPEAYRKLSSKEKRQLRNKISARNFRTRRKEHIAHLEQQVADRDTLIEGLRQQLALVKVQNKDLAEEVRVLKSKSISNADVTRIIEALQKGASSSASTSTGSAATTSDMGPPSLLRSSSNSSLNDTLTTGRPSTPASPRSNSPHSFLARPNMRKDLPSSSNASSKSFWGGVGGTGNNFMSVHTVLVPNMMQLASSESTFAPQEIKGAMNEKMESLARLVDEKLKIDKIDTKGGENVENLKSKSEGMQESDVNEAIVSLLGNGDVAPPSYSEAIQSPPSSSEDTASTSQASSVIDLGNNQVSISIVSALHKALSSTYSPIHTRSKSLEASSQGSHPSQLDSRKITALLEGRATLVLYDEHTDSIWKDESGVTSNTPRLEEIQHPQASVPIAA